MSFVFNLFNSGCESLNFNKVYSTPNVQPSTMLNNVDHSSFFPYNTFSLNHEMLRFTKVVVVFLRLDIKMFVMQISQTWRV